MRVSSTALSAPLDGIKLPDAYDDRPVDGIDPE